MAQGRFNVLSHSEQHNQLVPNVHSFLIEPRHWGNLTNVMSDNKHAS